MIFRSPHAPVAIPEVSITDYLLSSASSHGTKPALIDGTTGRTINYSQFEPMVQQLAAGFARYGVKKGETFAIYCPNLPEYVIAFHALATLGAVVTMVPPLFTDTEIETQLKDSQAKYILTIPQLAGRARKLADISGIRQIFVIGEAEGAVSLTSLLVNEQPPDVSIATKEDLAALPYSSGTTGFPKGVMLTHYNLVAMLCQMEAVEPVLKDDVMICVVPMYHLYGLHIVANLALGKGATVVTLPRYDEQEFLQTIEKYRVTIAPLVPPLVLALSRSPYVDNVDLSSLRLIHCGAASLADEIARACSARLHCEIRYGYGLTEVSPLSHASAPNIAPHKPGSVGFCLPNTECRIVDPLTGSDLGPNEEGEIWLRGPQVMKGYLGNPAATAEMLTEDGWLKSGDIGYADEEGQLFVVDRLKELIKYKGRQVAPAELEALLLTHPLIGDAAVVPIADEEAGEVPKAFVVLKNDNSTAVDRETLDEEIISFVASRIAPHKRIRKVEFVSEIPKSPAGKILRRVLKERKG